MLGKKDEVNETRQMLCAAFVWGGLPSYEERSFQVPVHPD